MLVEPQSSILFEQKKEPSEILTKQRIKVSEGSVQGKGRGLLSASNSIYLLAKQSLRNF